MKKYIFKFVDLLNLTEEELNHILELVGKSRDKSKISTFLRYLVVFTEDYTPVFVSDSYLKSRAGTIKELTYNQAVDFYKDFKKDREIYNSR